MNQLIKRVFSNPIKKITFEALVVSDGLILIVCLLSSTLFKGFLYAMIISLILDAIIWLIVGSINKCPHCKEPFGLQKVASRFVGSVQTTMNVQKKVRDRQGRIIASIDDYVPATRNDYINTYKCMYCGGIKESKSSYKTMN